MKFAFCFKGVHFIQGIEGWKVDFENTIQNFYSSTVLPLESEGHSVDIFISTYDTEKTNKMLELYKPKKTQFHVFNIRDERFDIQYLHIFTLYNLVKEYEKEKNIEYDIIVTTRFDVFLNRPFLNLNLDLSKMNIAYKQDYGDCDDCFWIFPRKELENIILSLKKMSAENKNLHQIEKYFPGTVHFVATLQEYSTNRFFTLVREARNNIHERRR
jgi:hypothetical protein